MTSRQDIDKIIADKLHIKQNIAREATAAIVDYLTKGLAENRRIEIRHFGSFTLRNKEVYSKALNSGKVTPCLPTQKTNFVYFRMSKNFVVDEE